MRTFLLTLILALALPIAASAQQARVETAISHVRQQAASNGLSASDVAELVVTNAYESRRSGTMHVYIRQQLNGLDITASNFTVNVDRGGRVFHAPGNGVAGLSSNDVATNPAISAGQALQSLANDRGLGSVSYSVVERSSDPAQSTTLRIGANETFQARLVYNTSENGELALAWEVSLPESDGSHYWLAEVDAMTGAVLQVADLVVHDEFGGGELIGLYGHESEVPFSALLAQRTGEMAPLAAQSSAPDQYRVYPQPVMSPIYTAPLPPADARVLVVNPANATASPFGWHDTNGAAGAEFTTTQGNNVWAHTDTDANNVPDAGSSPDGGGTLSFDFPLDLTLAPSMYRPAAVTNLFYWNNIIHDVMYQYGFDEASGNFQTNNYGNGGLGNDHVLADAQDGSGVNNANFATFVDGISGRMQMYIGTNPNPDVDGDLDNHVIVHEYGHGISNRLTGGPAVVTCLQNAEQMGEGWSDWIGLAMTTDPADTRTTSRSVGNYLFGQPANGPGIRPAPYNTNFAVNGFTYQDTRTQVAPHGVGFVWATILFEVQWDLIDLLGFDPNIYDASGTAGNQIILQLVTEGMKLQPCSPGFVDGRDAILAADVSLYGGAHTDELWAAFARRGLGLSATQGSTFTNSDNTEAFDVPPPTGSLLDVTCTPISSTPIPAGGGRLSFTLDVVNNGASPETFDIWYEISGAASHTKGPFAPRTLAAGGSLSRTVGLGIPAGAPPGAYTLTCNVGTFPLADDTSPFPFTKSVVFAPGDPEVADWSTDAELEAQLGDAPGTSAVGLPTTAELLGAYPNPFNPTATIRYALSERGPIELSVYNTIGQRVAVLASGVEDAGQHEIRFDASSLPSGVYVYTLRAEGQLLTGRLMLVK